MTAKTLCLLLYLLRFMEGQPDLCVTQAVLDDVQQYTGRTVTLEQMAEHRWARAFVVGNYMRRYSVTDMHTALRTWNGGPRGPYKHSTLGYLARAQREQERLRRMGYDNPMRKDE